MNCNSDEIHDRVSVYLECFSWWDRKICRQPRFEFHLNNSIHFDRFVNLINSASNIWPEAFITDLKGGGDYQSSGGGEAKKQGCDAKMTLDTLSQTFTVLCVYRVSSSKRFI